MKNHPFVQPSDVERWQKSSDELLPIFENDILEGKTQKGRRFHQLADEYKALAMIAALNGEWTRCKELLGESANTYLTLLTQHAGGADIKPGFLTFVPFQYMLLGVIAGMPEKAKQLASLYGEQEPDSQDHPYHVHAGRAVKYALLGDLQRAIEESEQLLHTKVFTGHQSSAAVLAAVIMNDRKIAESKMLEAVGEFEILIKTEYAGLPDSVMHLDLLGYINLFAYVFKSTLNVPENPLLPKQLLP